MNCEDPLASRVTRPPGTEPGPCTENGRAPPWTDDAQSAAERRGSRRSGGCACAGRRRRRRCRSRVRRPAGRSASRCRPGRSRPRRRRSNAPGVTTQSSPDVSTVEPSEVRAAAISRVSRERSARRTTDGPSAIAARTSARLVSDLLPGSETTASTGWAARGAGHGSGPVAARHPRQPSGAGDQPIRARASLASRRASWASRFASRRASVATRPGPPGDARLAVGVAGGDDEAAHEGDVLEEVQLLLGALGLVLDLPEPMPGERGRDQRRGEHCGREPGGAAGGQRQAGTDLDCGIDLDAASPGRRAAGPRPCAPSGPGARSPARPSPRASRRS